MYLVLREKPNICQNLLVIATHCPLGVFKSVSYCINHLSLDHESYTENTLLRTKYYLIEKSLRKLLETLGAHKALLVVKLPIAVHYLLYRGKATLAALTHGIGQSTGHVAENSKNITVRIKLYNHPCLKNK